MAKGSRRRKRRDSWGSITEVERGKKYVIRYWGSTDDRGYRRCCETVRGTREDAERRRAELMLDHSKDAPCPTLGQVYERWYLPSRQKLHEEGDIKLKTMQQDASLWNAHVSKRWKDVPCDQIRPLDVQNWVTSTLRGTTAPRAVNLGKRVLDFAVRYEFIDSNPMALDYVMPSKSTIEKRDDYTWTSDELCALWRDHAYGTFWEGAFLCAAFGSARVGESLSPKADDVWCCERNGVFAAVIPIKEQVSNTTHRIDDTLKTAWSERSIVILGPAGRRVMQLARRNAGGYLTDDGFGRFVPQHRLWKAWVRSLGDDVHPFKNLRKSYETTLKWDLKVPSDRIERIIGHVGDGVTGYHYDRPEVEHFIDTLTECYAENPYMDSWDWCRLFLDGDAN